MKRRVISLFLALIFAFTLGAAAWADAEPLPEASAEPLPEASAEPAPEASAEPEPEASTEPAPEASTEPAPEASTEPAPEASEEPAPEASAEPEPEASTEPEPEASTEPAPEASAEPEPEASAEPEPEASTEPEPDEEIAPAAEEPVTGECGNGTFYELIGGELHIKPSDDDYSNVYGFWHDQDDYDSWYPYVDQITKIVVEDGVTEIGDNAFRDLTSVTSAELAESVDYIWENAFAGCTALTDLTVRNALCYASWGEDGLCPKTTTIHAYENSNLQAYAERTGNPFVSLGQYAASGTWDGGEWSDAPGSGAWTLKDGVLTVSGTGTLYGGIQNGEVLNGDFCEIGRFATSVVIKDGISGIDSQVSVGMGNLVSVTIPSSVKRIDAYAFAYCRELKDVLNPDGTPWDPTGIEGSDEAFLGTPWLEKNYGDADGFVIINGKLVSYVGPGGDIRIPDSVTAIGWGVFNDPYYGEYNDTLTSVVIPPSVTEIGEIAFWRCRQIKSLELPEGLQIIGDGAFESCIALAEVKLPSTLTYIGYSAFCGCPLTSVNIPAGVKTIGGGAFSGCPLTSVDIPAGVSTIEYSVFEGCESLASVSLPEGLQTIEEFAFDGTALTSVTIPESVTSVGTIYAGRRMAAVGAFNKCPNLTSVTVLNKDCDMCLADEEGFYGAYSDDLHTHATIRGHLVSTAQRYAEKYQYKFEPLYENDMTGDGAADIEDVQFLFRTILDGENVSLAVGDYCKDDIINLKDITALYQLVSPAQG